MLGTDKVGRDYLSRLIYGAQISLLIGFLTILISGTIGTALGVVAGYFGGRVDMVVNFIINTPPRNACFFGRYGCRSRFWGLSPCCNNGTGTFSLG